MSKGFCSAEQGKRASSMGPLALYPIPRSGTQRAILKKLSLILVHIPEIPEPGHSPQVRLQKEILYAVREPNGQLGSLIRIDIGAT